MASGGGGAWKVAYADFVTAMMAFFMVMWLTSQKPEVKQAVAGYFRDPYALYPGNEKGSAADATPTTDPKRGHQTPTNRVHVLNSGDETNYQFDVPFADDSDEVDAIGRDRIRSFVPNMIGKLNRVEIRAHCQRKPLAEGGPFKDRWDLCYARGRAVQKELELQGIEGDRIRLSQAEANEPMALNLTDDELRLNSRVDVILLPDLVETPWSDAQAGASDATEEPRPEPQAKAPSADAAEPHAAAEQH
jgi:chemotaxis protein MotB